MFLYLYFFSQERRYPYIPISCFLCYKLEKTTIKQEPTRILHKDNKIIQVLKRAREPLPQQRHNLLYKIKGLASRNVLKFPLVWAVALWLWTRLTGPLSARGSIHRARALHSPTARVSPIVTTGQIQKHTIETACPMIRLFISLITPNENAEG